jgi:hypothetical protein
MTIGRRRQRHPARVATAISLITAALLGAAVVLDPAVAERLSREDDVVEWMQAGLFALAAVFALASAWATWRSGASPVLEILITGMLTGLVIGELDLDKMLLGRKIISTRFLVDGRVGLGWRALAGVAVGGPPVVLAIYALRRRAELVRAIRRTLAEPGGQALLVGVVIFGLTEAFEKPLGRIPGLPKYFLEETFELIAGMWLSVGTYAHWRRGRVRP